ncbi:retrovirus-related pol polyprotein from transposon TNT 1-94 [Tanacetum coccineum]|uniref:Retrovirus-related pol polyprotein from transposon TNT 1-94 n=1 Tax=Tanacetum coccineum TaxID=301880 RepID=A0ABQ5BMQ2_9ASTR
MAFTMVLYGHFERPIEIWSSDMLNKLEADVFPKDDGGDTDVGKEAKLEVSDEEQVLEEDDVEEDYYSVGVPTDLESNGSASESTSSKAFTSSSMPPPTLISSSSLLGNASQKMQDLYGKKALLKQIWRKRSIKEDAKRICGNIYLQKFTIGLGNELDSAYESFLHILSMLELHAVQCPLKDRKFEEDWKLDGKLAMINSIDKEFMRKTGRSIDLKAKRMGLLLISSKIVTKTVKTSVGQGIFRTKGLGNKGRAQSTRKITKEYDIFDSGRKNAAMDVYCQETKDMLLFVIEFKAVVMSAWSIGPTYSIGSLTNIIPSGGIILFGFPAKATEDEAYLSLQFMRPLGCSLTYTYFNLDHLGITRKVQDCLHVNFLENQENQKGKGPDWMLDLDLLTPSWNYIPSYDSRGTYFCKRKVTLIPLKIKLYMMELTEPIRKVSKALADESWVDAMQEELLLFNAYKSNGVFVTYQKAKRVIGTKWVFRNKRDERGTIIKNKARLVAQGYRQEEGVDYDEVFAPVAPEFEAIRSFWAFAILMGIYCRSDGVKSDLLVVMATSRRGLHQAPREWIERDILLVKASALVESQQKSEVQLFLLIRNGIDRTYSNGTPFLMYPRAASSARDAQGTHTQSAAHSQSAALSQVLPSQCCSFSTMLTSNGTDDLMMLVFYSKSPNDYTPQSVSQTSGGDDGTFSCICFSNREVRRDSRSILISQAIQILKSKSQALKLSKFVQPVVKYHALWVENQKLKQQKRRRKKQKKKMLLLLIWIRRSDETEEVNSEEKEAFNVKSGKKKTEELDFETTHQQEVFEHYWSHTISTFKSHNSRWKELLTKFKPLLKNSFKVFVPMDSYEKRKGVVEGKRCTKTLKKRKATITWKHSHQKPKVEIRKSIDELRILIFGL